MKIFLNAIDLFSCDVKQNLTQPEIIRTAVKIWNNTFENNQKKCTLEKFGQ